MATSRPARRARTGRRDLGWSQREGVVAERNRSPGEKDLPVLDQRPFPAL
jgi:hypothetical protein